MRGQVAEMVTVAKETGTISFGGEYSFLVTDSYSDALVKLYRTGCEIGGVVKGNGFDVKVYPCYDPGFWSFHWGNPHKGVWRIAYWSAEFGAITGDKS